MVSIFNVEFSYINILSHKQCLISLGSTSGMYNVTGASLDWPAPTPRCT